MRTFSYYRFTITVLYNANIFKAFLCTITTVVQLTDLIISLRSLLARI